MQRQLTTVQPSPNNRSCGVLLSAAAVNKSFASTPVLRNVSFALAQGTTLGVVGESGCGKTTLARILIGLTAADSGTVYLHERPQQDWLRNDQAAFRRAMQYVFQDPIMSLNPRKTVAQLLDLPLRKLTSLSRAERTERVRALMDLVSLRPEFINRYPHEFSGGQCQRIGIARALATEPSILLLDEPVSALDVSVQAQILNLLRDLQQRLGLSYIFISHDLAVVEILADQVLVMQHGMVVEHGPRAQVFSRPQHAYTKRLLASVPSLSE